jgi:sugar/nucleoside kinase (ribokinase family)
MPVRDLTFAVAAVPGRGQKFNAAKFGQIAGGNALNAAIGISRLGGKAVLTGPVGDQAEGASRYIFDDLAEEGIDTSQLVHVPGLVTPISAIMIDPSGERTIVSYRDPGLWTVKLPPADVLLRDCDAILIESRCAQFATDLCHQARQRGIVVVVDIDSAMAQNEGLLTASTHLIFSDEALQSTAGIADSLKALRKLASLTSSFLAVTRGPKGTLWLDADGTAQETPAFPVHVVDTLGAGDIFHGAFALEFATTGKLAESLRFASAAAALKCTRPGGAFAAPTRDEVERLLARG